MAEDQLADFLNSFGDQPDTPKPEPKPELGDIENPVVERPFRKITPEVQKAFTNWLESKHLTNVEVPKADYLMTVYTGSDYVARTYYQQTPQSEKPTVDSEPILRKGSKEPFVRMAQIDFGGSTTSPGEYELRNIVFYSEKGLEKLKII